MMTGCCSWGLPGNQVLVAFPYIRGTIDLQAIDHLQSGAGGASGAGWIRLQGLYVLDAH